MRDYDIESDLKQEKFQHLKLVQGDRGNKIKINVFEDGQPVNLTGCSITAKYKRADVREGIGESSSSGGSAGGGEVTVDLSDYYKKIETYSRKEIDAQFKDIANLNFPILLQNLTFFYTIYGIVGGEIDELAK